MPSERLSYVSNLAIRMQPRGFQHKVSGCPGKEVFYKMSRDHSMLKDAFAPHPSGYRSRADLGLAPLSTSAARCLAIRAASW